MLKKKNKKQVVGPVLVVAFLVVILGAILFLDTNPELTRIESADAGFVVEGDFPAGIDVTVTKDIEASSSRWTAVASDVYVVGPDDVLLPVDVFVRMPVEDRSEELVYSIGYFDTELGAWVPLDTLRDPEREIFEAQTNHFSHWALLATPRIEIPEIVRERLIEEALSQAPANAAGYHIAFAYSAIDSDYVLLADSGVSNRCPVSAKSSQITTATDVSAMIVLDGIELESNVRAIAEWDLGEGCGDLFDPQDEDDLVIE